MKRDLPRYIRTKTNKIGKTYLYFERGGQRTRMLSEPLTPEFWAEYAKLQKSLPTAPPRYSWSALIKSYRASESFLSKAPRTRRDYAKILDFLDERWGKMDPRRCQRKDVIHVRNANAKTVRFANYCVQIISILLEHSIDLGWLQSNAAKGVSHLKTPKSKAANRKPWPEHLVEKFRQEPLSSRARLLFELCVGTGQRIGDVLKMKESDIEDGGINVVQGKTGAVRWIPITPHLQAALDARERPTVRPFDLTLAYDEKGHPISYRQASHAVMAVRRRIGAEAYDIHSLRYTTAAELGALGQTDEQIMSITGHASKEMVAKYAGMARQKSRATEAQGKRK